MRRSNILLCVVLLLTVAACSEPQCQPDELRVGITCRAIGNGSDGSVEAPDGFKGFDGSVIDGDAESGDASRASDGAASSAADAGDGGATASRVDPDSLLDLLPGGPPSFQFRADTVTRNGDNLASIPNRRGSDALVVAAGMLAAPSSDSRFAGAQVIAFTGTQWLDSNLPAGSWTFLHDGTGAEVFVVHRPGSGNLQTLMGTTRQQDTISTVGMSALVNEAADTTQLVLGNAGQSRPVDLTSATALAASSATYANWQLGGQGVLAGVFDQATSVSALTAYASAPSAAPPQHTLRVGANAGSGDRAFLGAVAEILIFSRSLHEYERQLVREYIEARYGIAAPSLTGAERVLMSALPFSMVSADHYLGLGGKVIALLDRACPGHVFAQYDLNYQPNIPAAEPALNGQLALTLSNHTLQSGFPANAWTFIHGVESTVFHVFRTGDNVETPQIVAETWNGGNGISQSVTKNILATAYYRPSAGSSAPALPASPNTAYLWRTSMEAMTVRTAATGSSEASAAVDGASSTTGKTMALFARANNSIPYLGQWARSLWFGKLSASKRAKVEAALSSLYGVSP